MTHQVSDEQYGRLRRRLDEVALRVDRGTTPYDPVMNALTLIIEGEIPQPDFKRDMRKESGWELIEDMREPAEISIGNLELVGFLNHDEQHVTGEEMKSRAHNIGAMFGQHHAEYLLDHQEEIPESWRGHYLVFHGTVWRGRGGGLLVPCLAWDGGRWIVDFYWFNRGFSSRARLLRPRK